MYCPLKKAAPRPEVLLEISLVVPSCSRRERNSHLLARLPESLLLPSLWGSSSSLLSLPLSPCPPLLFFPSSPCPPSSFPFPPPLPCFPPHSPSWGGGKLAVKKIHFHPALSSQPAQPPELKNMGFILLFLMQVSWLFNCLGGQGQSKRH